MDFSKSVLIFADMSRAHTATAVKESILKTDSQARVIIIDDMTLHSAPALDFAEKLLGLKINRDRKKAVKFEENLDKRMDAVPHSSNEFKGDVGSYEKMKEIIDRIKPFLIITIGYGAFNEAIAVRDMEKLDCKVINVVDEYVLNNALINTYMDGYIVENEGVKQKLIDNGIDSQKIAIAHLPIRRTYLEPLTDDINVNVRLNKKWPKILYFADKEGVEHEKVFHVLKNYLLKYDIFIYCGSNRELYQSALKNGLRAYNEGISLPHLYEFADVVLTAPISRNVSIARAKGKLVALLNSEYELEKRNAEYLKDFTVDCSDEVKLKLFLECYPTPDYKALAEASRTQYVITAGDALSALFD